MLINFQSRNNKFLYYLSGHLRRLYPTQFLNFNPKKIEKTLTGVELSNIFTRLNYYNKIDTTFSPVQLDLRLKDMKMNDGSYSLDFYKYSRYFNQNYRISRLFGDVNYSPNIPTFVKSRPIDNNYNSVLMKLNEIRHFYFVRKDIPFSSKKDSLVWRGASHQNLRKGFLDSFYSKSDMIDVGDPSTADGIYSSSFLTISQQLKHKFILSIEGNDVATNTKWIMSSNSLCFMRKPRYETWFMEGKLIPNFHYVLLKDDFSDILDKIEYFLSNPEEAKFIIKNANEHVDIFRNKKIETLLNYKVMEKYFEFSKQH